MPGGKRRPDYPFGINRLMFAAAVFTDSAVCFSTAPPREKGERFSIWDELDMGVENRLGWLGAPEGPTVHLAYRLFEYGMVLANPSDRPATFDLDKLTPGRRYRRLRGSPRQDPQTNNGQPVGKTVTIPPLDALFLVRVAD